MPERFKVVCIPCKRYTSARLYLGFTFYLHKQRVSSLSNGRDIPALL